MPEHSWHIIGAGAIGNLVGSHLRRAGLPVQLIYRAERKQPTGPLILHADGEVHSIEIERGSACDRGTIQRLLVCTKADQAVQALQSVSRRLSDDGQVILLHNGMGSFEDACKLVGAHRVFAGITTEGAFWNERGELVHAGKGSTRIGQPGLACAPPWFQSLARAWPRLEWDDNISESLWRKLLINCAINPLTALHGCRNGELANRYRVELDALCTELAAAASTIGYPGLARDLARDVLQVCTATADNQSSMLSDLRAGRPSEIEAITGYFCRRCEELDVECSLNRELLRAIRELEARWK